MHEEPPMKAEEEVYTEGAAEHYYLGSPATPPGRRGYYSDEEDQRGPLGVGSNRWGRTSNW